MEFPFAFFNVNPISIPMLLIFLFISHNLLPKWQRPRRKQAPSPPGSWPIIGHLHLLHNGNAPLPHHALGAMADKYGPIFRLQLGTRSALVVSNREMAREAMWLNDAAAASRPSLSGTRNFSYDYVLFGLAPTSPYWREMRKIANSELLSNRRVDQVKNLMFGEIDMSLSELHSTWAAESETKRNGLDQIISVELKSWFGDVALNMVLKIIMGKRCVGPNAEGGKEEEEAKEIQKAIKDSFNIMGRGLLSDYFPLIEQLGFDGDVKKIRKIAKRMDMILQGWLEEHERKRACGNFDKKDEDFMDSLLSLLHDDKLPHCYDAQTIVKATTLNMISGGTESITVTLTWAISLMLNNPHTLERAQQELDVVVGRHKQVNKSDISKLVYMQAIVKETMRLYPPAPLLGQREFLKDCVVAGYFIPRGTQLMPNIWKIQTDSRVWPDPLEFKPERFLTTHKDVDLRGNHFELVPFGSGRRMCPGVSFGLQMLHFTLSAFLHSFTVKNPTGEPIDMSESFGMANEKVMPLNVLVTPRLPSHLHSPNRLLQR